MTHAMSAKRLVILGMMLAGAAAAVDGQATSPGSAVASKWTGGSGPKSEMDGSPTVIYSLQADRSIQGWPQKTTTPTLSLRCKERHVDAFVRTGFAPQPTPDAEGFRESFNRVSGKGDIGPVTTIRIRFDDAALTNDYWSVSADQEAIFSREPIPLVDQVAKARVLRIEFVPYRSSPQVMLFSVQGFGTARLDALFAACPRPPS